MENVDIFKCTSQSCLVFTSFTCLFSLTYILLFFCLDLQCGADLFYFGFLSFKTCLSFITLESCLKLNLNLLVAPLVSLIFFFLSTICCSVLFHSIIYQPPLHSVLIYYNYYTLFYSIYNTLFYSKPYSSVLLYCFPLGYILFFLSSSPLHNVLF